MNYTIVIAILAGLLLIALYLTYEKNEELNRVSNKLSELKLQIEYLQSEKDQLSRKLESINKEILQYEQIRYNLSSRIRELETRVYDLNLTLDERNKAYDELLQKYIELNNSLTTFDNTKALIEEIKSRLDWVGTNYRGTSPIYESLKGEVSYYCLNNSVLDLSCTYQVIEKYIKYDKDMTAVNIFRALEMKKGDCLTYSMLMHRLIIDLKPLMITYLVRNVGKNHQFVINNTIYTIRDHSPIKLSYNLSRVACYGYNNDGHCDLLFDDLLIAYKYGIYKGKIGENIDYCKTKRDGCEWRTGYITMIIEQDDIKYMESSLRQILERLK